MEQNMSAHATLVPVQRESTLTLDDMDAVTELTREGPEFRLGDVTFCEQVWETIPHRFLHFAVDLHQCGSWGSIPTADALRNSHALKRLTRDHVVYGRVVSRWTPFEYPKFWVVTERDGTCVFFPHQA